MIERIFRLAVPLIFIGGAYFIVEQDRRLSSEGTIEGKIVSIADPDTFEVMDLTGRKETIRLFGVDAPEKDQTCITAEGFRFSCGVEFTEDFTQQYLYRTVSCIGKGRDRYDRLLSICSHNGDDIASRYIKEGKMWAFTRYSKKYMLPEAKARVLGVGYWSGHWEAPWVHRRRQGSTINAQYKETIH